MDVRIGVIQTAKEIELDLPDDPGPSAVHEIVTNAMSSGGMIWLTDRKGRQVGVPTEKVAYVEIGAADSAHRIGFGG